MLARNILALWKMRKHSRPGRGANRTSAPANRTTVHSRAGAAGLIFGWHAVRAALANPRRRCRRLHATPDALARLDPEIAARPPADRPVVHATDRQDIDRILGDDAVHQGVALEADPLPEISLDEACASRADASSIVVALDQVTDPHNVGAILRTAAAFGARAVIVTRAHAPAETGVLAKAASGALDVIPLVRVANLARALDDLADLDYWRVGLAERASAELAPPGTTSNLAIVLGAEGKGLRRLTTERCDALARLPTDPALPSLNVSNAAAVALYILTRRG
jgi:23S rRNA (guanosine2251-2'-O)-methyltransferase